MPDTYCLYEATQSAPHLTPQIQISDVFCVACPTGGACRGAVGQRGSITIRDDGGREASLNAILQNANCVACPDGSHRGYTFAPAPTTNGGW